MSFGDLAAAIVTLAAAITAAIASIRASRVSDRIYHRVNSDRTTLIGKIDRLERRISVLTGHPEDAVNADEASADADRHEQEDREDV